MSAQGAITPSLKDKVLFGTIKSSTNTFEYPSPSHSLQAPAGLLKEKSLGSISSIVNPVSGQEKFDEKIILSFVSLFIRYNNPSDKFNIISIESANLCLSSANFSSLLLSIIILSTKTSISCFLYLSNLGISSIS